jgi:tetratricopeptide (TPR) repeat protein
VRRGQVLILVAVCSGLLSVLLAVAVNVATGGTIPAPLDNVSWLAWPAVGLLAGVTAVLGIWQQRLAARDGLPSRHNRTWTPPAELPAPPVEFAGRADELAAIDRLLKEGHRVVALVGAPGAGKSTLALHVAHRRRARYPDGQLYAALRGASASPANQEAVLSRFLTALGVPDDAHRGGVDDLAARYRSALADRRALVLLDDARDADQVRLLLPGGDNCLVLVTSRRQLTDLANATPLRLGGLNDSEGRALLASAVPVARIAADPEGTARILRYCGGLPLAIRLAAARLRARPTWTPNDLADRLEDERHRLDELRAGDTAVRLAFEASYVELPDTDKLVFRRAGSHPGQVFGVGAAAALAGLEETAVAAALERLVDLHLVESPAPGRYRLHDLLRLFATEQLTADENPGERDACLSRLLDWLTTHARAGSWLATERDNVLAASHQGVASGDHERVWTLATTVHPLLDRAADHPDRLALWQSAAVAAEATGDDHRRARALRLVAESYRNAGEVTRALAPAAQAVAIAQALGDRGAHAEALFIHGEALRDLNQFEEAEKALTSALRISAALGDAEGEAAARAGLGTVYLQSWQPELAIPVLEPAVTRMSDEQTARDAWVLLGLSTAYRLVGRRDEAVTLHARTLATARRLRDEYVLGYAVLERAWFAFEDRRFLDGTRHAQEALAIFEEIRHGTGIGLAQKARGEIAAAAAAGRHGEAVAAFDEAIATFERLGDRAREGRSRLHCADALPELNRLVEANTEWAAAEQLLGDTATPEVAALRARLRDRLGDDGRRAGADRP